ncbi:MAG: glutathione peroxidase [Verrucomicrobiota bacterium]
MKITVLLVGIICCAQMIVSAATASLYDVPLKDINGKGTSLKAYQGKVLLLVNVASKCGFTPQYDGLEALHQKYKAKGFAVLGFPCNDFGAQEPGTNEEIKTFCSEKYHVTFPMFDKLHVKGPEQHPLYAALTGKDSNLPGDVKWNFGKFLIGRDGKLIKRFDSKVAPDAPELVAAVEAALAK